MSEADRTPAYLEVRIAARDQPERVPITDGVSAREELARFLNRQGPYAQLWILLTSGEYVRYDAVVSISDPSRDG